MLMNYRLINQTWVCLQALADLSLVSNILWKLLKSQFSFRGWWWEADYYFVMYSDHNFYCSKNGGKSLEWKSRVKYSCKETDCSSWTKGLIIQSRHSNVKILHVLQHCKRCGWIYEVGYPVWCTLYVETSCDAGTVNTEMYSALSS